MDIEEGEKVLNTKLIIYDDATKGDNYGILTNVDTSVEVDIGCIRLIFLNKFVSDILVSLTEKTRDHPKKCYLIKMITKSFLYTVKPVFCDLPREQSNMFT